MKKLLLLSLIFSGCVMKTNEQKISATTFNKTNEQKISATTFNKTYYTLCHRGVEYISRSYGESSFTVAVDKNNKPIECK